MNQKVVFTDLDGTLRRSGGGYSDRDFDTLKQLGELKVHRVVATGRSLKIARNVLPDDFPIDYLIFSSGAGIWDWNKKNCILKQELSGEDIRRVTEILLKGNFDFMIQDPIPENHLFSYHETGKNNSDFVDRRTRHAAYSRRLTPNNLPVSASQFVVIDTESEPEQLFQTLTQLVSPLSVIRATSPLDGKTAWIEILSEGVSKSVAASWLCRHLGVSQKDSMAIGNDFNDVDLLNWVAAAMVVSNTPESIRKNFQVVASNDESGFSEAVERWLANTKP